MTSRVQVRAGDVVSIFSSDGKTPLGKLTVESSGDGIIWIRGESVVAKVGDVMVVHPSPHDPETCWHCRAAISIPEIGQDEFASYDENGNITGMVKIYAVTE